MLPGFLTTALEIIIILDVCGAIVYFTLTGMTRIKNRAENADATSQQKRVELPAFGLNATGMTPALESVPVQSPTPIYTPNSDPEAKPRRQWTAGLKRRLNTLKQRFTYQPAPNGQVVASRRADADFDKLGRVLDSFKEEA